MTRYILIAAGAAMAAGLAVQASAQATTTAQPQLIGLARAVAAAESAVGAKGFDAELDMERGALVYDVSLVKDGRAVEVEIDAVSGQVLRRNGPAAIRLPWTDEDLKAAQIAPRTLTEAIAMIETATKGKVHEIGLERHAGRDYYEVELAGAQDRDVRVDVRTGAITPVIDD